MNLSAMNVIVESLIERGYNPYSQIKGYITTGNVLYITSHNNARKIIKKLDLEFIEKYLNYWEYYQDKGWKNRFLAEFRK